MSIFQHPLLFIFFSFLLCPVASLPGANGPPKEVKSGHCTFWNGRYVTAKLIETAADCQAAAKVLGLPGTVNTGIWSYEVPPGCGWYPANGGGSLRFNTNKRSTAECKDGIYSYMCLCVDLCPIGNYQNEESSKTCKSCRPGTYNDETGQALCKGCTAGQYSSSTTKCEGCGAGTYSGGSANAACLDCGAGQYSTGTANKACNGCGIGTYSSEVAATSSQTCQNCTIGKYNNEIGESTCRNCPAGKTSQTGASHCQPNCCHAKANYPTYEKDCNTITDAAACSDRLHHLVYTCDWNCDDKMVVNLHNVSQ